MKNISSYIIKINFRLILVLLLCGWALFLRYETFNDREWGFDEQKQYRDIQGPFRPFWQRLHYISGDHSTFPGEYLISFPFVHWFKTNKWGIALPHIISTLLGFYFLYRLCRKYLSTIPGYIIVFAIVCFNKYLILHSFELRPYAVLPTLYLANLYLSAQVIENYKLINKTKKGLLSLYFIFSMFYHAYGVIIYLLPVLFNLAEHRKVNWREYLRQDFVRYFLNVFLVGVSIWGWYASGNYFGLAPALEQYLRDPFHDFPNPVDQPKGFFINIIVSLFGQGSLYPLALGVVLFLVLPIQGKKDKFMFFLSLVTLPLMLILFIDLKSSYWFLPRQFVWVMPAFALFIGWCWDAIFLWVKDR